MPVLARLTKMVPNSPVATFQLKSGWRIPALGYGVYQCPADVTKKCTLQALKDGYRHVDCARAYKNEAEVGEAIRESGIKREEIFYTTKIPSGQLGYEKAKESIEYSLQQANIGYIDLMLIHAPYGGRDAREGAWRALVEAQKAGKVRSIGVSNYGLDHLNEWEEYSKKIGGDIDVGQYELHPWCNRKDIVDWLKKRNIVVEAYAPLVRAQRMNEPILQELSKKYNKTPGRILLRYSLQKGFLPLVKSQTESRIKENLDFFNFELSEEDLKKLDTNEYTPICWDPTTSGLDN